MGKTKPYHEHDCNKCIYLGSDQVLDQDLKNKGYEEVEEEDVCEVCGDYDDTGSGTCTECMNEEEID